MGRDTKIRAQARMAVMAGVCIDEKDLLNPYTHEFSQQRDAEHCAAIWDAAFVAEYEKAERERLAAKERTDEEI